MLTEICLCSRSCCCFLMAFLFSRAPVLVALALIECGMEYEDAVHFIRQWVQACDHFASCSNYCTMLGVNAGAHSQNSEVIQLRKVKELQCLLALSISFSLSGNVAEPSTQSSCFTWKTTNLNSVSAPKMQMASSAVYSRKLQTHSSWLRPPTRDSDFIPFI